MSTKKINRYEKYSLKGALRKNGFDHWRFVTSAISKSTNCERTFFIEFMILNPLVSPEECQLGFKSRFGKTEADLQYALAGTDSAKTANSETLVQPSFVMVKAGQFGDEGKQINAFFPFCMVEIGNNDFILKIGNDPKTACIISDDRTQGVVQVTKQSLVQRPEYMCQAGTMGWNLKFEKELPFTLPHLGKRNSWYAPSGKANFTGTIVMDGEEFIVQKERSFGYYDRKWGREYPSPYFHLSSSNLVSLISGKLLEQSCLTIEGEMNGKLCVYCYINGERIEFNASKGKFDLTFDCIETPEDEEGVKLHWTVSISDRVKVVDVDVFCNTRDMFLRDYEAPEGERKLLKVLGGGKGNGEIRLYNKVKKNLILIEHARISDCICEYGSLDNQEN